LGKFWGVQNYKKYFGCLYIKERQNANLGGGGGRRKAPEKETLIYKKRPEEIPQLKERLKATNH